MKVDLDEYENKIWMELDIAPFESRVMFKEMCRELRAARDVAELGQKLEPRQPSEVKLGEYLVDGWADFVKALEKYDEVVK